MKLHSDMSMVSHQMISKRIFMALFVLSDTSSCLLNVKAIVEERFNMYVR